MPPGGSKNFLLCLSKMAQVQEISRDRGPVILLLDDFLTDFDKKRAERCLADLGRAARGNLF